MDQDSAVSSVFQLRVVIRGISPLIWRRLLVPSGTTIASLHGILQIVLGWEDVHLHRFRIHGKDYGISYLGGMSFSDDPRTVRLSDLRLRCGERFVYEYNFTAHWECDIRLEAVLPEDPRRRYPLCSGGRRAAPPEDCRGPWEYLQWLDERQFPFEAMHVMAHAIKVARSADPQVSVRKALGKRRLRELAEAIEEVDAYLELQPERFDRGAVNNQLRAQEGQEGERHESLRAGGDR